MTKLSEVLPSVSPAVQAIYDHYKQVGDSQAPRGYLGASIIGHQCSRYLWYTFRACCQPTFDGRMYRLFQTGEREESRACQNLRDIGCVVESVDDQRRQFAVEFLGGHFAGHLDGSLLNLPEAPKTWHVLEIKTHNTKSFNQLKKEGVKQSKPMHYAQMQVYMHGTGMTRALYFAVCKETDEIYTERVRYDKEEATALIERAERIITATEPPPRIADRSDSYLCNAYGKKCDAHAICWGCDKALPLPVLSCKQCCYVTPDIECGGWCCDKHKAYRADVPCDDHLCLPGLFPYAEPTDYTDGMICFRNWDDGKEWQHGVFCYSTKELLTKTREEL